MYGATAGAEAGQPGLSTGNIDTSTATGCFLSMMGAIHGF
jgi:hypothetical protein